jgi:hypothetical protein
MKDKEGKICDKTFTRRHRAQSSKPNAETKPILTLSPNLKTQHRDKTRSHTEPKPKTRTQRQDPFSH